MTMKVKRVLPFHWRDGSRYQVVAYWLLAAALFPILIISVCLIVSVAWGLIMGHAQAGTKRVHETGEKYLGETELETMIFDEYVLPLLKERIRAHPPEWRREALSAWLTRENPTMFFFYHENHRETLVPYEDYMNGLVEQIADEVRRSWILGPEN